MLTSDEDPGTHEKEEASTRCETAAYAREVQCVLMPEVDSVDLREHSLGSNFFFLFLNFCFPCPTRLPTRELRIGLAPSLNQLRRTQPFWVRLFLGTMAPGLHAFQATLA